MDERPPEVPGTEPPAVAPETEPSPAIPNPLAPVELTLSTDDNLLRPDNVMPFSVAERV